LELAPFEQPFTQGHLWKTTGDICWTLWLSEAVDNSLVKQSIKTLKGKSEQPSTKVPILESVSCYTESAI
jgi:hypothetical protein